MRNSFLSSWWSYSGWLRSRPLSFGSCLRLLCLLRKGLHLRLLRSGRFRYMIRCDTMIEPWIGAHSGRLCLTDLNRRHVLQRRERRRRPTAHSRAMQDGSHPRHRNRRSRSWTRGYEISTSSSAQGACTTTYDWHLGQSQAPLVSARPPHQSSRTPRIPT